MEGSNKKRVRCEIWSRVCGYYSPLHAWNEGKKKEFDNRKMFKI